MGTKQFTFVLPVAMLSLTGTVSGVKANSPRPNIVLILTDDLSYDDVGFNAKHFGVETNVMVAVAR